MGSLEDELDMPNDEQNAWKSLVNGDGQNYFWNRKTGYTTWTKPSISAGTHKAVAQEESEWLSEQSSGQEEDLDYLVAKNQRLQEQIQQSKSMQEDEQVQDDAEKEDTE